jgi:iduronate 2-sulfatase
MSYTMKLIISLIVSALSSAACAAPLNVLFIAVDDLRPELGCYGRSEMKTPYIDKLASQGITFQRAYCQVAVCNPSRNSVLSGCRPDTTGIFDNQHFLRAQMPDVITLPQHFKNNGYTTLSHGKVFHHSEREPGDDPQSWSESAWYHGEPYKHWFTKESLDYVKQLKALPKEKQPKQLRAAPFEAADEPDEVYPDGQTATKAIGTLQRLKSEAKPFFLAIGFVKPHLPFTCPQKYWDLYPESSIHLPKNSERPAGTPEPTFHNNYELRSYGTVPEDGKVSQAMALNLIRGYRACVSFMDAQVGRVLTELERLGMADNTLVVLWGDHGYHLGDNGAWTKMTNFEIATRVPLIIRQPGNANTGVTSKAIVELVDLFPTLSELCGLQPLKHWEGKSMVPVLKDSELAGKDAAFSQYLRTGPHTAMGRSIRTQRWRYTEWHKPKGDFVGAELYDHDHDPDETKNLATLPEHKATVSELSQRLKKTRETR